MCAAPAHEIVCMSAMYKTRGCRACRGFPVRRAVSFRGSFPAHFRGGCVPRGRRRGVACGRGPAVGRCRPHPAGRRVVRGPCPGMAVARRAAGAGPLTWATAGGGRAGAARGVARAGAVRDGSATTSTSRVTEPMRAGAGKRKTNNPLKYERRHTRISDARLFAKQCREHTNRQWVGLGAIVRHRLAM